MLVAVLQDFFVSNFGPYEMLGGAWILWVSGVQRALLW